MANNGLLVHNECYLYHGTDGDSAKDIVNNGLNADAAKGVDEFWDQKGLSLTDNPEVAKAWAQYQAARRGGTPQVIRTLADKVPARGPGVDEFWDAGEKLIDQDKFGDVIGGIFEFFN